MDFKELIEYDLKDYLNFKGLIVTEFDLLQSLYNSLNENKNLRNIPVNPPLTESKFEEYKIDLEIKAKVYYTEFKNLSYENQLLIYDSLKKKYKSSIPDYNKITTIKISNFKNVTQNIVYDFLTPLNDYFFQYLVELIESKNKFEYEINIDNSRKNFKEFNESLFRAQIMNSNFNYITDPDKIFQSIKYLMGGNPEGEERYLSIFSENDFINFYRRAFLNEEIPKVTPKNLNRQKGKFISCFHKLYSTLEGIGINEFGENVQRGGSIQPYIDLIHLNVNGFENRAQIENNFRKK